MDAVKAAAVGAGKAGVALVKVALVKVAGVLAKVVAGLVKADVVHVKVARVAADSRRARSCLTLAPLEGRATRARTLSVALSHERSPGQTWRPLIPPLRLPGAPPRSSSLQPPAIVRAWQSPYLRRR